MPPLSQGKAHISHFSNLKNLQITEGSKWEFPKCTKHTPRNNVNNIWPHFQLGNTGLAKLLKTRGTYGPRRSCFFFGGMYIWHPQNLRIFLTPSPLSLSHSRNLSVLSSACFWGTPIVLGFKHIQTSYVHAPLSCLLPSFFPCGVLERRRLTEDGCACAAAIKSQSGNLSTHLSGEMSKLWATRSMRSTCRQCVNFRER